MQPKITLHNHFQIECIEKATGKQKGSYEAQNVVLNQAFSMYNGLFTGSGSPTVGIALGTGSGTPAVTDTALFTQLFRKAFTSHWVYESAPFELLTDGVMKRTYSVQISEDEAIGDLTELGIYSIAPNCGNALMTHAMITDSEQNPITIHKTIADILNITATVYFKVSADTGYDFIRCNPPSVTTLAVGVEIPANLCTTDADPVLEPSEEFKLFSEMQPIRATNAKQTLKAYGVSRPPSLLYGADTTALAVLTISTTATTVNNQLTRTISDAVASTAGNLSRTYMIKGLRVAGGFWLEFPNHNVYTPHQYTFTLTGDGATTDFDLPLPEVMTSNVSITIDDIPQDPSTYTFTGKSFSHPQAWASLDNKYVIATGQMKLSTGYRTLYAIPSEWPCPRTQTTRYAPASLATWGPRVYDFKTPKSVNTFKNEPVGDFSGNVTLEYSSDNETWTQAAQLAGNASQEVTFTTISARYWRLVNLPVANWTDSGKDWVYMGFDYVEPCIRFTNPPANESVIKVTCYCEYPIKNSNWRIDSIVQDTEYVRSGS